MMSSDDASASAPGSASASSSSSSSYNPPCLSRSSSSSTMTSVYQEQQERRTEARPAEDVPQSPEQYPIKPSLPSNIDHEDDTCTSTLESPPHLERRVHRMIPSPAPAAFHAPVLPRNSRILRATPFQRLVHHRNLPKSGTIDPLKINEYLATAEVERAMAASVSVAAVANQRNNSTAAPPISEIEIKVYPKNDQRGGDFVELCSEDWKGLYMSSQRELYHSQRKLQHVVQENRFWKRQLIELQKRLYETRRNNHLTSYQNNKRSATTCMCPSCVAHHAAVSSRHYAAPQPWTVPESYAPTVSSRPSKRLRVGFQVREVSQYVAAYSSSSHTSKGEPNLRAVSHEEQQVGQQPLETANLSCTTTTTNITKPEQSV